MSTANPADAADVYCQVYWPWLPEADEKRDWREQYLGIIESLRTEQQGILVVRDQDDLEGPIGIPVALREAIADFSLTVYLLVRDDPDEAPCEMLDRIDWTLAHDNADRQQAGRLTTFIWCDSPKSARQWLAYLNWRSPDTWVAQVGVDRTVESRILWEGKRFAAEAVQ